MLLERRPLTEPLGLPERRCDRALVESRGRSRYCQKPGFFY
ncbi:MAG: hypothetical protein AB4352_05025 [Hormoscilla sp.]